MPEIKYKSINEFAIQDFDVKNGIITGYLSAFGNKDAYGDIVMPGAFKKTIAERGPQGSGKIKHLLQHDTYCPIATYTVLKEDSKGLYFEAKASRIQKAQDILIQYAEKIYDEHSIGYRVIKEEQQVDSNGNWQATKLMEVFLYEGSTVLWGANSETPFTGFKTDNPEELYAELEKRQKRMLKALRIDGMSDETYENIELELTKITQAYKSLSPKQPEASTVKQQPITAFADDLRQIFLNK